MTDYAQGRDEPLLTASTTPPSPPPAHYAGTTGATGSTGASQGDSDASMKDKATDSAQNAKQAAGDVASTAVDSAKQVAEESKNQARNLVGEARGQLQDHAMTQHQNLVSNLNSLADELHSMSSNSQQQGPASDLVGQAGQRASDLAGWLESRGPGDLVDEVRNFARRRPGAFLAGALIAGVLAGRLTRGVVAVHQSDDSSNGTSSPSVPQTGGTAGYGTGYATPPAAPTAPLSQTTDTPVVGYSTPPATPPAAPPATPPTTPGGGTPLSR
jgi:hypothetical protein